MYTATTKQILQPVAEAIAALIVINAEVEANNAQFPDMVDVTLIVDSQAKNLVDTGMSMLDSNADDIMRKDMPPACDQITASAKLLVEAAQLLKSDGRNKGGRIKLVEGCQGILQGTTRLLDAYDDGEVRKIVKLCTVVQQNLETLKGLVQVQPMLEIMRPVCQQLVDLTALSSRRVDEMLIPILQQRLRDAISQVHRYSQLVVSSCKAVAQNSKDDQVVESRTLTLSYLQKTVLEIETVVQIRDYSDANYTDVLGRLSANRNDIQTQFVEIMTLSQEGKKLELGNALESFHFSTDMVENQAVAVAKSTPQKEAASELNHLVTQVQSHKNNISLLANLVCDDPSNTDYQKVLHEELQYASKVYKEIAKLSDSVVAADLMSSVNQLKDHTNKLSVLGKYYIATKSNDMQAFANIQTSLLDQYQVLNVTLDHLAVLSPDADTFRQIRNAQTDLQDIVEQVRVTGNAHSLKPNDKNLGEHFNSVVEAFESRVKKLETEIVAKQAIFTASQLISSGQLEIDARYKQFQDAVQANDSLASVEAANGVLDAVLSTAALVRRAIENTNDPQYKQQLQSWLDGYENLSQQLKVVANQLDRNQQDVKAQQQFTSLQGQLQDQADKLKIIMTHDHPAGTGRLIPEPLPSPIGQDSELEESYTQLKAVKEVFSVLNAKVKASDKVGITQSSVKVVSTLQPILESLEESTQEADAVQKEKLRTSKHILKQNIAAFQQNANRLGLLEASAINIENALEKSILSASKQALDIVHNKNQPVTADGVIILAAIERYNTALSAKDKNSIKNSVSDIKQLTQSLVAKGIDQAGSAQNDTFKQKVQDLVAGLEKSLVSFVSIGDKLAINPVDNQALKSNGQAEKQLLSQVNVVSECLSTDLLSSSDTVRLTESAIADMSSFGSLFGKSVALNDKSGFLKAVSGMVVSLKRLAEVTQREINNTSDSQHKLKLQGNLASLNQTIGILELNAKKLQSNPQDTVAQSAFKSHFLKSLAFGAELLSVHNQHQESLELDNLKINVGNDGPQIQEVNGEEVEIVSTPAPEPLSEEEAKLNPIKAAAQDLKVQAAQYSTVSNPIVDLIQSLADKMASIAQLYKDNTPVSKSSLMKNVQEMQVDITNLLKHAKSVQDNCTDKSLKLQLSQNMERMQTLSVQLKIVAAVKIAEPRDTDSEKQLVLCSQSLMATVRAMLKNCEACSLRSLKTTANVAMAAIKFRKVLFKKGSAKVSRQGTPVSSAMPSSKSAAFKPVSLTAGVKQQIK